MPQNPQTTISQTSLKHYNELRNVRTESLRWVQMTTDTGIKLKVETPAKERAQQLLEFITIDILKLEQKNISIQDIITLPMTLIINSYFNIHPMSWELIHCRKLHPSDSVMKAMCLHKTLYGLKKYCTKKINKSPCTIYQKSRIENYQQGNNSRHHTT